MATPSKRQLLYVPTINRQTFLLFFRKGDHPSSWSLRDYSQPGRVAVHYASEYGWDAEHVRQIAIHAVDASPVPTTNLQFWHELTLAQNAKFKLDAPVAPQPIEPAKPADSFPLFAEDELLKLPKAAKVEDMRRIRTSPNSEDWVSWSLLKLLQNVQPQKWWQSINEAAAAFNPHARLALSASDEPKLVFWRKTPAPSAYERLSRQRMLQSDSVELVKRAQSRSPVEGESEIDVIVESRRHLIFLEAKLGSDVSAHTTYDPARNQIARNIDCVLETALGREPVFWMLVRDTEPGRMYVQLIDQYRSKPELLKRDLPHRDEQALQQIATKLSIIQWRDLGVGWLQQPMCDPLAELARVELLRRIT